jgi:hypothetical protein
VFCQVGVGALSSSRDVIIHRWSDHGRRSVGRIRDEVVHEARLRGNAIEPGAEADEVGAVVSGLGREVHVAEDADVCNRIALVDKKGTA